MDKQEYWFTCDSGSSVGNQLSEHPDAEDGCEKYLSTMIRLFPPLIWGVSLTNKTHPVPCYILRQAFKYLTDALLDDTIGVIGDQAFAICEFACSRASMVTMCISCGSHLVYSALDLP
jgi:hypothetical protein